MNFKDIVALVEEKLDGRSFVIEKHFRWANIVRKEVAQDALTAGGHGLYFLYRSAVVDGGSIAGNSRYSLPDDFVGDLNVFYAGTPLQKIAQPHMALVDKALPILRYAIVGNAIELIPTPQNNGDEIKMVYYAMPGEIDVPDYSDYFITRFPMIHVYGMAKHGAEALGKPGLVDELYQNELNKLTLINRRYWLGKARFKLQAWDEVEDFDHISFPRLYDREV